MRMLVLGVMGTGTAGSSLKDRLRILALSRTRRSSCRIDATLGGRGLELSNLSICSNTMKVFMRIRIEVDSQQLASTRLEIPTCTRYSSTAIGFRNCGCTKAIHHCTGIGAFYPVQLLQHHPPSPVLRPRLRSRRWEMVARDVHLHEWGESCWNDSDSWIKFVAPWLVSVEVASWKSGDVCNNVEWSAIGLQESSQSTSSSAFGFAVKGYDWRMSLSELQLLLWEKKARALKNIKEQQSQTNILKGSTVVDTANVVFGYSNGR